jgi:hypothetical protein
MPITAMPIPDTTFSNHLSYAIYLLVSIGMTIWVARVLSRSGEVFLIRCFGQDQELATSTNRLLVIGFYLVNIGFICLRLNVWPSQQIELIPAIGSRIGVSVLVLGLMHFFNMLMIARFGKTVSTWMRNHGEAQVAHAAPPPLPKTY